MADKKPTPRRTTRQRVAVEQSLKRSHEFRSAQQIHDDLSQRSENVGLTTVYRTLQTLVADGAIDVIIDSDGEARYRDCSDGHHHHLVCRSCGTTVEVAGPTVERWASRVAEEQGFARPEHTIEITGICPTCQAAATLAR